MNTLEKLHAKVLFQARQHATHGRLADAQFIRRPGEAATSSGRLEDEQ
jgi:hypothetical protein